MAIFRPKRKRIEAYRVTKASLSVDRSGWPDWMRVAQKDDRLIPRYVDSGFDVLPSCRTALEGDWLVYEEDGEEGEYDILVLPDDAFRCLFISKEEARKLRVRPWMRG